MKLIRNVVAGSLGLSSLAFASETRVGTLQSIGGIQDETDVFRYSALVNNYSAALIELGTSANSNVWGAAMTKVDATKSLGIAINRHSWISSFGESSVLVQDLFMAAATGGTDSRFAKGQRSVDLLGGLALGSNSSLGLRLSLANDRAKQTDNKANTSAEKSMSAQQIAIGYSSRGASALDLNLALMAGERYKASEKVAAGTTSIDLKGGTNVRLEGRWLQSASQSGAYVDGAILSRSAKATESAPAVSKSKSFSDQAIRIGGGYAYQESEKGGKFFVGADFVKASSKGPKASGTGDKFTTSISTSDKDLKIDAQSLSASLSGEGKFYDNFGIMFGGSYPLFGTVTEKDEIADTKTEQDLSVGATDEIWSFGVYWAAHSARVDASFSKKLLHNGPNFIAGNTTSPMLGQISATYSF